MPRQSRAESALAQELTALENRRQKLKEQLAQVDMEISVVERIMERSAKEESDE